MNDRARNVALETAAFSDLDDLDSWQVYADWLQEQGDPRGEIASLYLHQRTTYLSERRALVAQLRERERPFIDAWHAWAQSRDLEDVHVQFKRGFAHDLSGPLGQLAGVLDELFERDPIQRLTLTDCDDELLMQICERQPPWFARLRYLRVQSGLGTLGAAALAKVSLPELERLNLLGNDIEADACGHLARLDTRELRALTLTANEVDDEALGQLLESPTRSQWRLLYLASNPITGDGLARLAATSELDRLEGLFLAQTEVPFAACEILLDNPSLPRLATLELSAGGTWRARELRDRMRERWGSGFVLR